MPEAKKILLVTLSNLGDAVLTLPVLQSLRQANLQAEIHVIAGSGAKVVFENDARIARLTEYDRAARWSLIGQVRRERYDMIVDLRYSMIGFFGGAKRRNAYLRWRPRNRHRALRHLQALDGLVETPSRESFLKLKARAGTPFAGEGLNVVVAAVGSKSDLKKWPAGSYAKLLDRLAFDQGCRIALIGDKNDVADSDAVKKEMVCASQVIDLTGKTSFEEMTSAIAGASLLITNDSSPLHIADSLNVPVLAIFGPSDPRKYGPRGQQSLVVRRGLFCSPCEAAQCRTGDHACLKDLTVEEVHQKALSLLQDRPRRTGNPRILVVRLDRIGDVVLSLPAIHALRERFPDAHISVLLRPATRALLEGHPDIDEVIPYDYKKWGRHRFPFGYFRLWKEIVRCNFDMAFVLHPGVRSTLLPFLAGIPYRIGYRDSWRFLLTSAVHDLRKEGLKHESEYALDLVHGFGVPPSKSPEGHLFVSAFESAKITELTGEGPFVAIHAGSSCASKRWPLVRFERLSRSILEEFPYRVVLIGGEEERSMGRDLKQALGARAVDLTGKLDLKQLCALLKRSELLVSNDSGPVHVAAALGRPVISIFGRNQAGLSPRRWKPLGRGHTVLQKDVGCVVCLAHRCPIGFECLEAIEVEDVMQAVRGHLKPAKKEEAPLEA